MNAHDWQLSGAYITFQLLGELEFFYQIFAFPLGARTRKRLHTFEIALEPTVSSVLSSEFYIPKQTPTHYRDDNNGHFNVP